MKTKLIALASGAGLLASTVSGLGFDVDFPLTPSLWLVIAICAMVMATAHAAIGNRIHSIVNRETGTCLSGAAPSLSDSASSISDRSPSICQDKFDIHHCSHDPMRSRGVIVTPSDAIPAPSF